MQDEWRPKQAEGLIAQQVGDETVVFSSQRNEVSCLPFEVAQLWKLCDGDTAVRKILRAGMKIQNSWCEADVEVILLDLERRGLLQKSDEFRASVSRRSFLKTAAALPMVVSVVLPGPLAAMSSCVDAADALDGCGNIANLGQLCRQGGAGDCVDCRCVSFRFTSGTSCDTDLVVGFGCADTSVPPLFGTMMASCADARLVANTMQTTYTHCLGFLAQTSNAPAGQSAYVCWEC